MSGDAQITGRINISPPITWGELHDQPWAVGQDGTYPDVRIELDTTTEHGPNGVTQYVSGTGIIPTGHETSAHHLLAETERIVSTFGVTPDGTRRTFAGFLHVVWGGGESIYRVIVRGRRAVEVRPEVVWPEGARDSDGVA